MPLESPQWGWVDVGRSQVGVTQANPSRAILKFSFQISRDFPGFREKKKRKKKFDPFDPIINRCSAPQKTRFNPHIDGVVRRVYVTFHVPVELPGGDLGARPVRAESTSEESTSKSSLIVVGGEDFRDF